MYRGQQRLGEDVGDVVVGVDLTHLNVPVSYVLSYFQIAPVNMPRALAKAPVLGQFAGARVVDVQRRGEALIEPVGRVP
eukprot:5289512-Pleurochrysis_carterae.AAC.1